jgi:uncharacterized protein (DUF1800 family)
MQTIERGMTLDQIDPEVAWKAWEPSAAEPWDIRRAAMLYRRAGFGASESTLRDAVSRPVVEVLDGLFEPSQRESAAIGAFESESELIASAVRSGGDVARLSTWWLHRMLNTPWPPVEKMTLFWHGHFATGGEKVRDIEMMYRQNVMLRESSLGDFRKLVHGVAKDPAMLIYLDSATNRKAHANENFARELMELFCLGEGHYTEADVQELARCFTGWEIRRRQFRFNPYQHDDRGKRLLGGEVRSGEEAIDRVLDQPQVPRFIARKAFRFFVCDEPEAPDALIEPLAQRFVADGLKIGGMMRMLIGSRLAMSDWSLGRKVRSPIEMTIGLMRACEATTDLNRLSERLASIGQAIFFPPNVKGWDGGRAWINSSTLVGRANLIHDLVHDPKVRFGGKEFAEWLSGDGVDGGAGLVDRMTKLYLAVPLSQEQRQRLLGDGPAKNLADVMGRLATLPQFHVA